MEEKTRKKQTVERRKQDGVKDEKEKDDEERHEERQRLASIMRYSVRGSFDLSAVKTEVALISDERYSMY